MAFLDSRAGRPRTNTLKTDMTQIPSTLHTATNLRHRLRHDLAAVHGDLDGLASRLDLRTRHGLAAFLAMQLAGFRALLPTAPPGPVRSAMADLAERAAADLNMLGAPEPAPQPGVTADPLALAYVIGGSRLGTVVLAQRWRSSRDPAVRAASAYFSAPDHRDIWRRFCATASRMPADGPVARVILRDARAVFDLFLDAARASLRRLDDRVTCGETPRQDNRPATGKAIPIKLG